MADWTFGGERRDCQGLHLARRWRAWRKAHCDAWLAVKLGIAFVALAGIWQVAGPLVAVWVGVIAVCFWADETR